MKVFVILALIASSYGTESPASLAAGPGPIPPPTNLICVGEHLGPNKTVIAAIKECKFSDRFGDGEGKLNKNCVTFCVHKAMGIINSDLTPWNGDKWAAWAADTLPANQVALAQEHLRNCYEKFGTQVDLNDATCSQNAIYDACLLELQPKTSCPAKSK